MNKIHLYDKIISPFVTEKSTNLSEQNKIVFKVPSNANKKNLKTNIEKIFSAYGHDGRFLREVLHIDLCV